MDRYTKATDFVRLEKDGDRYEFNTVTDTGVHYIDHYTREGALKAHRHVTRERGNDIYIKLIKGGYKPVGLFEKDILGHKMRKG